jgi:hypothetical protein
MHGDTIKKSDTSKSITLLFKHRPHKCMSLNEDGYLVGLSSTPLFPLILAYMPVSIELTRSILQVKALNV